MYAHSGEFPLPVGMHTLSQVSNGSSQSVPSTRTTEGDRRYVVKLSKEANTAVGGMLNALPT